MVDIIKNLIDRLKNSPSKNCIFNCSFLSLNISTLTSLKLPHFSFFHINFILAQLISRREMFRHFNLKVIKHKLLVMFFCMLFKVHPLN